MNKTLFATIAIASILMSAPAFANDAKTGAATKKACTHSKAACKKATKRHAAAPAAKAATK